MPSWRNLFRRTGPAEANPGASAPAAVATPPPAGAGESRGVSIDPGFATGFRGRAEERDSTPMLGPWAGLGQTARFAVSSSRMPETMVTSTWSAAVARRHPDAPPAIDSFVGGLPSLFSYRDPFGDGGDEVSLFRDSLPSGAAQPLAARGAQRKPIAGQRPQPAGLARSVGAQAPVVARRVDRSASQPSAPVGPSAPPSTNQDRNAGESSGAIAETPRVIAGADDASLIAPGAIAVTSVVGQPASPPAPILAPAPARSPFAPVDVAAPESAVMAASGPAVAPAALPLVSGPASPAPDSRQAGSPAGAAAGPSVSAAASVGPSPALVAISRAETGTPSEALPAALIPGATPGGRPVEGDGPPIATPAEPPLAAGSTPRATPATLPLAAQDTPGRAGSAPALPNTLERAIAPATGRLNAGPAAQSVGSSAGPVVSASSAPMGAPPSPPGAVSSGFEPESGSPDAPPGFASELVSPPAPAPFAFESASGDDASHSSALAAAPAASDAPPSNRLMAVRRTIEAAESVGGASAGGTAPQGGGATGPTPPAGDPARVRRFTVGEPRSLEADAAIRAAETPSQAAHGRPASRVSRQPTFTPVAPPPAALSTAAIPVAAGVVVRRRGERTPGSGAPSTNAAPPAARDADLGAAVGPLVGGRGRDDAPVAVSRTAPEAGPGSAAPATPDSLPLFSERRPEPIAVEATAFPAFETVSHGPGAASGYAASSNAIARATSASRESFAPLPTMPSAMAREAAQQFPGRAPTTPSATLARPPSANAGPLSAPAFTVHRTVESTNAGPTSRHDPLPLSPVSGATVGTALAGSRPDAGGSVEAFGSLQPGGGGVRATMAARGSRGPGVLIQRIPPIDGELGEATMSETVQADELPAAAAAGGGAAPAAGAPPAAEQDIEKLAERVWQVVRRKLTLERERRRGIP